MHRCKVQAKGLFFIANPILDVAKCLRENRTMDLQTDIAARKERWGRFLRNDNSPRFTYFVHCNDPAGDKQNVMEQPHLWPELKQERIEWAWQQYEAWMQTAAWRKDDWVPHLSMITGTEIFAEAFGCEVSWPEHTNPFALPMIRDASEVSKVKVPELSTSSLAMLFEMADELVRRGGPEAALKMVDVQSPMDVAALVWDKCKLFPAMIMNPEAVLELADKTCELLTAFHDEWFRRYGTGRVAHYPNYYVTDGITLSEDEVGAVSPEMFEQFFLPGLTRLSQRYNGMGIHCCADARHQWDNFLKIPGLFLMNLGLSEGAYDVFGNRVAHYHHEDPKLEPDMSEQEMDDLLNAMVCRDGCRTVLNYTVEEKEDALRLVEKLERLRATGRT